MAEPTRLPVYAFRLPSETIVRLRAAARREGVPVSALIRRGVERVLAERERS